jgi:hypothetical protein
VPWSILDELPIALDHKTYFDVPDVADEVRRRLNELVSDAWRAELKKPQLRAELLADPRLLDALVRGYAGAAGKAYDFDNDPRGYRTWIREADFFSKKFPLALAFKVAQPAEPDVRSVIVEICEQFKRLVEDNGLWQTLYEKRTQKPRHEHNAQLIFFAIAYKYCRDANIDISPEPNAGRGPVDFKFSRGYQIRVLVEVKLTTNQRLCHGLETQLRIYEKAERTRNSIYLVIDTGGPPERIDRFRELVRQLGPQAPQVIWVDGLPKESASKA